MTSITLILDDKDHPRGFSVREHSGYADKGKDVVCAAISVLTINTLNAIETFTDEHPVIRQGEAELSCRFDKTPGHDAQLLLKTWQLGIESIHREYAEHVKVEAQRIA